MFNLVRVRGRCQNLLLHGNGTSAGNSSGAGFTTPYEGGHTPELTRSTLFVIHNTKKMYKQTSFQKNTKSIVVTNVTCNKYWSYVKEHPGKPPVICIWQSLTQTSRWYLTCGLIASTTFEMYRQSNHHHLTRNPRFLILDTFDPWIMWSFFWYVFKGPDVPSAIRQHFDHILLVKSLVTIIKH